MAYNRALDSSIIIFIILSILIVGSQTLKIHNHLHHKTHLQQSIYDEQRYLVELAERQNKFKQQIIQIQNDFAGINLMLNDSNINQNQKRIKLNEALADERDTLIQAQNNLNIPYQLKSCQCLELTEQRKIQLVQQLTKISTKISELQKISGETNKQCQPHKCPLMEEINNQITMLKNYQKIMQDTISSKCCKVIKYEYKDNLDTNNWHFGNTTQSQYQAKIYQREQTSNIKLQPCPYTSPFVIAGSNECFNCPTDKPLFNLGSRVCEKDCSQFSKNKQFVLNPTTHVCGLNKNCPQGQYYDETSKRCTVASQNYNESQCPPDRPFWDPLSLSCQSCPTQTPFFDLSIKKCRKCNQNEKWNQATRFCETSQTKCNQGYQYNLNTKKCEFVRNDTHSLCPPERPYWNEFTFSCDACSDDKPFYDPALKQCRVCNDKETLNQITKECVPKIDNRTCASDQFYNEQTKSCEKRGTTSMCPPSTPYWDSANFKCVQCPAEKPFFNERTHQCQGCPANSTWSKTYLACVQQCSPGQEYSFDYKKCIKTNKNCSQNQVFSYELNKCISINCNQAKPFWNVTANECQPCLAGTQYNYATNSCQKDSRTGNISVCYEDKPVWNAEYLRCEPCPSGTTWNSNLKQCVTFSTHHDQKSQNHRLHVYQAINDQFIEGQVYGNQQISYQHRWLHPTM